MAVLRNPCEWGVAPERNVAQPLSKSLARWRSEWGCLQVVVEGKSQEPQEDPVARLSFFFS